MLIFSNNLKGPIQLINRISISSQYQYKIISLEKMKPDANAKKYSKISSALKRHFLECLYFKDLTVKEAASIYRINYSTAKVILRDLTGKQAKFVKTLIKLKENERGGNRRIKNKCSGYRVIEEVQEKSATESTPENTEKTFERPMIQIISRVGFDFFGQQEKGY